MYISITVFVVSSTCVVCCDVISPCSSPPSLPKSQSVLHFKSSQKLAFLFYDTCLFTSSKGERNKKTRCDADATLFTISPRFFLP